MKQLEKKEYNPILLFKCQGDEQGVNMDNLAKDDFLMVIQTEFLRDIMMQYGQNAILIDSTHGLTQHNFLLITVMTIDEHGEGVPIAWAISNIEDTALLVQYFRALHGNVGDIKCETLMSDCADQFFSAWISIFGDNGTKRLLCRWHIDRAWRSGLKKYVHSKHDQIALYHQLCILMEETNEASFALKLQQFMSVTCNTYQEFHEYFKKEYLSKVKQWATCHRTGTPVNTNMYLESFHRLLKVVYFDSKHNRCVDHLLHTLIKLSRNLVLLSG